MNCQSFAVLVDEVARDRILDQTLDLSESVKAHLDECASCALRLQDGRALTQRLEELAKEMKSATAPASLEEELRRAFRERLAAPVMSPVPAMVHAKDRGRWNRWNLSLAGLAAVLLIVLGIAGLRSRAGRYAPPGSGPLKATIAQTPRQEWPFMVAAGAGSLTLKPPQVSGRGGRTSSYRRVTLHRAKKSSPAETAGSTNAIANETQGEIATQFMPLGYAGPINLQDGGQLVRVQMSRSAMLSLGLPVNMDRYSESVKADILLGADGFARAIRFVQ